MRPVRRARTAAKPPKSRYARGLIWASVFVVALSFGVLAEQWSLPVDVAPELTFPRVPMDPVIDFGGLLDAAGVSEQVDRGSVQVLDIADRAELPCAVAWDATRRYTARVMWVVTNPGHRAFAIRFHTAPSPSAAPVPAYVPPIGVGDLLRYNADTPRCVALPYLGGLIDLNGDGRRDLAGCWNYAYRPGEPWDGVVCYPGACEDDEMVFGDLLRLRYVETKADAHPKDFLGTYMCAAFADLNRDGALDLVFSPRNGDRIGFYLDSGKRDAAGPPVFVQDGELARPAGAWAPCRIVDLDNDGALDLVLGNLHADGNAEVHFLRNRNPDGWPCDAAPPVPLELAGPPCFFDMDRDGRHDAVCLVPVPGGGVHEQRIVWQRNEGGTPPAFAAPAPVSGIDVKYPTDLAAVDTEPRGLLVQHDTFQRVTLFLHTPTDAQPATFTPLGAARSPCTVMSLSDQAWPCLCDWDADGDQDLLIGGGYGWPRIVVNDGGPARPAFREPALIPADGGPIKILRNEILGEPHHWHNMGYPYPVFADWDADGLNDLLLPNETNRIFWYRNTGTKQEPAFGARAQLLADGFPESDEARRRSAERAVEATYPLEEEQPFFWRTGAAFADWNGDGLLDLATHDGATRKLCLFTQYRDGSGTLRLRKDRPLLLEDGRAIDDAIVGRSAHWTESFRAIDWDRDGPIDLVYNCAGTEPAKGSIYLLRNAGTRESPVFAAPRTFCCFGEPIKVTAHGPNAWPGDFDGDGLPDLIACVEWSVYPFYTHAALEMPERPKYEVGALRSAADSDS